MNANRRYCLFFDDFEVNTYENVILEHSFYTNEGHIGVNESILTVMKQIWTQMNSKRCNSNNSDNQMVYWWN